MSPIEYRPLGQTGVKVSSLCMGTMTFGKEADEATSAAIFQRCREAGINFFDCADVYAGGRSEEILGRLIASCRNDVVITSKINGVTGPGVNDRGLSRRHIMLGVEQSLKRLGTDRIDLYYVHAFDDATPIDEVLRSLDDLVTQGKILYPAVSNWPAWQIAKALGISTHTGWRASSASSPCTTWSSARQRSRSCRWPCPRSCRSCPTGPWAAGY